LIKPWQADSRGQPNDPDVPPSLGVGYRDDMALEKPQREETPLTVEFPIVFCRERESAEDLRRIAKIDAMLAQIRQSFRLIPRIHEVLSLPVATAIAAHELHRGRS
jgi:hypothetical protein